MDDSLSADADYPVDQQSSCQDRRPTWIPIFLPSEITQTRRVLNSLPATKTTTTQELDVFVELTMSNETFDSPQRSWPQDFMSLASGFSMWISRKVSSWFASLRSGLRHLVGFAGQHVDGNLDDNNDNDIRYVLAERVREYLLLYIEITTDSANVFYDEDLEIYIERLLDARSGISMEDLSCLPIKTFEVTSSASHDQYCVICLENYKPGDDLRTLPCFHEFHQACVDKWLLGNKKCPVCKEVVTLED